MISAWKKGWNVLAFVPCAVVVLSGMIVGTQVAANGGNINDCWPTTLLFDLGLIIVLGVMSSVAPPWARRAEVRASTPSLPAVVASVSPATSVAVSEQ